MMNQQSIKLWFCMAFLTTSLGAPAPQPMPLRMDIIDLAAISRMTPQQLEALAEGLAMQEIMRTKRSSAQALTSVASKASSFGSKVGFLGQASAGAASLIASASSKSGHGDEHGYSYEPHDSKVDFWGLKKSILYTLFQAVKAITGGVTILKGQLIKGGGALASTLGKVISVKGDAVSNIGKKIVNSAALSHKKPHSTAVYGPPPPSHVEYQPSAYGAPTAPAHYSHTAPSAPTGFAAHKYPSHLDGPSAATLNQIIPLSFRSIGRSKLNGVHAGLVILTPLADASSSDIHHAPPEPEHTPLEPPSSLLHTAFSAIKNVFSSAIPSPAYSTHSTHEEIHDQPPPPPPPPHIPPFKTMTWGAVNSYGEPATADAYPDYEPRNPHPQFNEYASSKHSAPSKSHGLTPEKLQKISDNLDKVAKLKLQRSSEELPHFDGLDVYRQMLERSKNPFLPTTVLSDAEIGVLPAEFLPSESPTSTSTIPPTTSSTTTSSPPTDEKTRRRKDVKYLLRGNRIIIV